MQKDAHWYSSHIFAEHLQAINKISKLQKSIQITELIGIISELKVED
jgi:hypothetical protein